MNILRKLGVSLLAIILSTVLIGAAWANIGVATIRDRQVVKGWFDKSGFYTQIVDVLLESVKKGAKDQTISLPIDDPAIQKIANDAFTPALIKSSIETVLSGSYDWLDGKTDNIRFTVDLTPAKQSLAEGIGTFVSTRVASLPVCALNLGDQTYDGFSAACRPKTLSAAQAGELAKNDFLKQDFLKDPVITGSTFKATDATGSKVPFSETPQAQNVKTVYQKSGQLPYALIGVSVLLSLGIIYLSSTKRRGFRRVGYLLLTNGVFLAIFYVGLGVGYDAVVRRIGNINTDSPKLVVMLVSVAKVIITDVKAATVWYMGGFIIFGVVLVLCSYFVKKGRGNKKQNHTQTEDEATSTQTTPILPENPVRTVARPVAAKPLPTAPVVPRRRPPRKIQL